jgi:hypothetical protein
MFTALDRDVAGSNDTDADLVAVDAQDANLDRIADQHEFAHFSRQDQHDFAPGASLCRAS